MIEYAKEKDVHFVKFINMLINDTTFMLDESLDALRRIHEYDKLKTDTIAWTALTTVCACSP
jgi:ubiquitin conjugation factor E4 B